MHAADATVAISRPPRRGFRYWLGRASLTFGILLAAVLTVLYHTIGDRHWLSDIIVVFPPTAWCLAIIVLFIPVAVSGSWRLAGVAIITIISFLIINEEWLSLLRKPMTPQSPRDGLRVICWNQFTNTDWTIPFQDLSPWDPDVVVFTESPDGQASEAIHKQLTGQWKGYHWHDEGDSAILSRFPMEVITSKKIGPWDKPALARLEIPPAGNSPTTHTIILCGVRFMFSAAAQPPTALLGDLSGWPAHHKLRLAQFDNFRELLADIRGDKEQVIVTGDFNTRGGSKSLRALRKAGLHDGWPESGTGWGATYMAELPIARIDQTWLSSGLRASQSRAIRGRISDHRMVIMDIKLRN